MTEAPRHKIAELERLLVRVALEHAPSALASSLSAEDMVITDAILRHRLGIELFPLETQRLHADTPSANAASRARYAYAVRVVRPGAGARTASVGNFGRAACSE